MQRRGIIAKTPVSGEPLWGPDGLAAHRPLGRARGPREYYAWTPLSLTSKRRRCGGTQRVPGASLPLQIVCLFLLAGLWQNRATKRGLRWPGVGSHKAVMIDPATGTSPGIIKSGASGLRSENVFISPSSLLQPDMYPVKSSLR